MGPELVLALDIGATKLAAGLLDRQGELRWSGSVPTPAEGVWDALDRLLGSVPPGTSVLACGVGCAGPMSPGGEDVSPVNIPTWRGFPLRARLAERTGLPTWVDNDAKALALGEGWRGAAIGCRNYLAMTVSTGIGGGIVLDGKLLEGRLGNAGHIGHVVVEPDGRRCGCGGRGCLEAEASGSAIAARTGAHPAEAGPATVEHAGRMVGRAVASVANLLDLSLTTLGGSVALGFGRPFRAAAQAEIALRARLCYSAGCMLVPTELGQAAPLVGAAAVALRGLSDA